MTTYTSVPTPPTAARLTELSTPHQIVRYLLDQLRLTQREIAQALRTTEVSVSRWARDPAARPRDRFAELLDDLRDIVTILAGTLPGEQTGRWLKARNRMLGGERPLGLIATDYARVRDAAEAYVDGDPL